MRCLAIAEAWTERGGAVTFLTATQIRPLLDRIRATKADVIRMDPATILSDDAAFLIETCLRLGAVAVVDGYQFDYDYQLRLRGEGLIVTVVDDYAHLPHYAACAILNQNSYAARAMYAAKVDDDADLLMGSDYALIRREFRDQPRTERTDGSHLMVTMGGGDPANVTELVLSALRNCDIDIDEVVVVAGPANPHRERLEQECRSHKYNVRLLTATNDMSLTMASCNMAITAAGSTCWELEYFGIPYIAIVVAENQVGIGDSVGKIGGGVNLGWYESVTKEAIVDAVARIKTAPPVSQLSIDGLGAFRAVDAIGSYKI